MPQHITRFEGRNRFLSNYYPYTPKEGVMLGIKPLAIEFEGLVYPSTEHVFQAAKTLDEGQRIVIRDCEGANQSKRLGRKVMLRSDWEDVKDGIMITILRKKFKDPDLKTMLLETGDTYLVEGNWWHDCYWGVCYCDKCMGTGQNRLGDFLMAVRNDLQAEDWSEMLKEKL